MSETDWFWSGIVITTIVFPLWASMYSDNKIKIFQRGMFEPFILGLIGAMGFVVQGFRDPEFEGMGLIIGILMVIAIVVLLVKRKNKTLGNPNEKRK